MKRRYGFTLTEQLIALTAGTALMMLAVSLVHRSMLIGAESRSRRDAHHNADRLANRLRDDVHWAKDVELVSSTEVRITRDNLPAIAYQFTGSHGVRREYESASVDRFTLDFETVVSVNIEPSPRRVVLLTTSSGRTTMKVAAVIGRLQNVIAADSVPGVGNATIGDTAR